MIRPVKNVILMICDGQGYNGWLGADYFQKGAANQQSYQQTRPDGTKPVHVAKAQRPSYFVDRLGRTIQRADTTGQGLLTDDYVVPPNAVAMQQQHYNSELFWTNSFSEQHCGRFMDSASSATALASGCWTVNGRLNTSWDAKTKFETLAKQAKEQGKKTAVVTTVQVSHATPAGMIARTLDRNDYADIFKTMLSELDVIIGCGHPLFDNHGNHVIPDDDLVFRFLGGKDSFYSLKNNESDAFFLDSFESLQSFSNNPVAVSKLVAIAPVHETLQQRRLLTNEDKTQPSGLANNEKIPNLAFLTKMALQQLERSTEGSFLMVEGGAVDWAHHQHDFTKSLEEQLDFNVAVDAVINWVEQKSSWQETLLIVTSDHETGALWGQASLPQNEEIDVERLEAYLSAPKNKGKSIIPDITYLSLSHSNNLVPLWALGANSERFLDSALIDPWAVRLWGEPYQWDGRFVEATTVYELISEAMSQGTLFS